MKHLTIAPAFSNVSEFVTVWVNVMTEWFREHASHYSIFLEHPESNAHLDINVWWPKNQRWDNFIGRDKKSRFKKLIYSFLDQNPASEYKSFFFVSKIPPTRQDTLYLVGYNAKEERGIHNIPAEFLAEGISFYEENKKILKVRKFMNTNALNVKNVTMYLIEQSETLKFKEPELLIHAMIKEGFSFVAMGKKTMRKAVLEFKTRIGTLNDLEKYEQNSENGTYMPDMDYLKQERVIVDARKLLMSTTQTDEEKVKELNLLFLPFQ